MDYYEANFAKGYMLGYHDIFVQRPHIHIKEAWEEIRAIPDTKRERRIFLSLILQGLNTEEIRNIRVGDYEWKWNKLHLRTDGVNPALQARDKEASGEILFKDIRKQVNLRSAEGPDAFLFTEYDGHDLEEKQKLYWIGKAAFYIRWSCTFDELIRFFGTYNWSQILLTKDDVAELNGSFLQYLSVIQS